MKKIVISNLKDAILDMEPSKETLFLLGKVEDRVKELKDTTVMYTVFEDKKLDEADVQAYVDEHFDELFKEAAPMAYEALLSYEEEDDEE